MTGPIETVTNWLRLAGIANVAVQKSLALVNPSMVSPTHNSGVVPWVIRLSPHFPLPRWSQAALLWAARPGRWVPCRVRLRWSQPEPQLALQPKNASLMWSGLSLAEPAKSNAIRVLMDSASAGFSLVLRSVTVPPNRWSQHCCAIVSAPTRRWHRPMAQRLAQRPVRPLAADWAARSCRWSSGSARSALGPDLQAAARADLDPSGASRRLAQSLTV